MSLKQDLLDAGVNLSDMAREIPDENYPNLYEVLRKEERGMPIRPGSAQEARLEKLRAYLASTLDGSVQTLRAEEQDEPVDVGIPDKIRFHTTRPVPRGRVLVRDPIRIKGTLCGPGTILNLSQAHGPLEAGTYMFIRALARPEDPSVPVEIDLYGGRGYLRAKTDKDGWPKWNAIYRTVSPEAFRRPRAAVQRQEEEEEDDD